MAKPFVFALVCQEIGFAPLRRLVGVDATGLPFDSIAAIERDPSGRTNPMGQRGASPRNRSAGRGGNRSRGALEERA